MTRGGARRARDEPERRCIATGESGPKAPLIRFVLGPGDEIVPDLAEKLPGRGAWLTSDPALVDRAVRKRLFSRTFRRSVTVPEDLSERLERLLAERLVARVALARKAGEAVAGFEKVRERVRSGRVGVILTARDAAENGREKIVRLAGETPRVACLGSGELGLAFGREFAIHAAIDAGRLARGVLRDALRLAPFRPDAAQDGTAPEDTAPPGEQSLTEAGRGAAPNGMANERHR